MSEDDDMDDTDLDELFEECGPCGMSVVIGELCTLCYNETQDADKCGALHDEAIAGPMSGWGKNVEVLLNKVSGMVHTQKGTDTLNALKVIIGKLKKE